MQLKVAENCPSRPIRSRNEYGYLRAFVSVEGKIERQSRLSGRPAERNRKMQQNDDPRKRPLLSAEQLRRIGEAPKRVRRGTPREEFEKLFMKSPCRSLACGGSGLLPPLRTTTTERASMAGSLTENCPKKF